MTCQHSYTFVHADVHRRHLIWTQHLDQKMDRYSHINLSNICKNPIYNIHTPLYIIIIYLPISTYTTTHIYIHTLCTSRTHLQWSEQSATDTFQWCLYHERGKEPTCVIRILDAHLDNKTLPPPPPPPHQSLFSPTSIRIPSIDAHRW